HDPAQLREGGVRVRDVVEAAHEHRHVDRGVGERDALGAALEVAAGGVDRERAADLHVDADGVRARCDELAHQRAVAAADVHHRPASDLDGVEQYVEVVHRLAAYAWPMPAWEDVVEIGRRFPGVEEGQSYGTPSLKVKGKFMCRMRTNPDALVVRVLDLADAE